MKTIHSITDIPRGKVILIIILILSLLGISLLFIVSAKQAENNTVATIEDMRDMRLVDRKAAENAACYVKYLYEIYDETSYHSAKTKLKSYMDSSIYDTYFVNTNYESTMNRKTTANIKDILSYEIKEKTYRVRLLVEQRDEETGVTSSFTLKIDVLNDKIIKIQGS